jgi:hypothetical protein
MAASKEELAEALERLASGQADIPPEPAMPDQPAIAHGQDTPLNPEHAGHLVRPLPRKPGIPPAHVPGMDPVARAIFLRQTATPLLLTLGVVMPLSGVASLLMGDDSPLVEHPSAAILLILLGVLILGAAVLNMLQLKHVLSTSRKR